MVTGIVFSKNRAAQLDALLQTVDRYGHFLEVTVLYKADNGAYEAGYTILKKRYSKIIFRNERSIKDDCIDLMNHSQNEYVVFMCDDDLIFRPLQPVTLAENELCFSYRLGRNTDYCYTLNHQQSFNGVEAGDELLWNWKEASYDFSYPFSVDFHLYRCKDMQELFKHIPHNDIINIEYDISLFLKTNAVRSIMKAHTQSSVVGVPNNRVQDIYPNRNAGGSVKELNDLFLEGKRINPFKMNYSNVRGAHQEIPYLIE